MSVLPSLDSASRTGGGFKACAHVSYTCASVFPCARARSFQLPRQFKLGDPSWSPTVSRAASALCAASTSGHSNLPRASLPGCVLLTREAGKNAELEELLTARRICFRTLPLVETAAGPDRGQLASVLQSSKFDWVCITSPTAARELSEAWRGAGRPVLSLAVVGEGTAAALERFSDGSLTAHFIASQADAVHLGYELPWPARRASAGSSPPKVLYPTSARAGPGLLQQLSSRGFEVTRLDVYDTVGALQPSERERADFHRQAQKNARQLARLPPHVSEILRDVTAVVVASPSAVVAWEALARAAGEAREKELLALRLVCIGPTTGTAARTRGFACIVAGAPTPAGLADAVEEAMRL